MSRNQNIPLPPKSLLLYTYPENKNYKTKSMKLSNASTNQRKCLLDGCAGKLMREVNLTYGKALVTVSPYNNQTLELGKMKGKVCMCV